MISAAVRSSGAPSVSVAVVRERPNRLRQSVRKGEYRRGPGGHAATRYAIGSVSKQFTAAALLLLAEHGKLSLDDKVSQIFSQSDASARSHDSRIALAHVGIRRLRAAGLHDSRIGRAHHAAAQILDQWAKKPLNFDPGTRWQYSNTNYVIAGQIFEKVSGQPLVAFLREKIFRPLGMSTPGDITDHDPSDASAYTRYALGPPTPGGSRGAGLDVRGRRTGDDAVRSGALGHRVSSRRKFCRRDRMTNSRAK